MKMKKTLAIIMTAALAAGTLAGCNQATLNYSQELSNTAKWEATTSNLDGTFKIDAKGMSKQVNFSATGYKAKDKAYVNIKLTDPTGLIKLPEIKEYVDLSSGSVEINKGYFEEIYTLTGQAVPNGLAQIKEEYLSFDLASSGLDKDKIKALCQPDGMAQFTKLLFGEKNDLDLPFVQNGREYSLNLNSDQTTDLAVKAIKAATNNLDNINTSFKMGLPAESITQMKAAVNSSEFDKGLAEVKVALAGSTISSKETFTDTSYNSDFSMNLKVKDFGDVSLNMKSSAVKSEVKEIISPTSVLKVTQADLLKILTPSKETSNTIAK